MTNPEEKQLQWHRDGKQGCMFAKLLSTKLEDFHPLWSRICLHDVVNKDLIKKIQLEVESAIANQENQALSIILPSILSENDALDFFKMMNEYYDGISIMIDESLVEDSTLLSMQLPSTIEQGNSFWVLAFAPFSYLPLTRQSPYFEIVLATKSKQYLLDRYKRHNHFQPTPLSIARKGEIESAHLADIQIPGITDNVRKDEKLWKGTQNIKQAILGDFYKDPRAKAKTTFSFSGWISL